MINIQYPKIDGNILCDGQVHQITPYSVYLINGQNLFLMEYRDETKGTNSITVLDKSDDGSISKVPLLNYNTLLESVTSGKYQLIPVQVNDFFKEYMKENTCIKAEAIAEDFETATRTMKLNPPKEPKYKVMAVMQIYVDNFGYMYYKLGNDIVPITPEMLYEIMQDYFIEWIDAATLGPIPTEIANRHIRGKFNELTDGVSFIELAPSGDRHHYFVSFEYTGIKHKNSDF